MDKLIILESNQREEYFYDNNINNQFNNDLYKINSFLSITEVLCNINEIINKDSNECEINHKENNDSYRDNLNLHCIYCNENIYYKEESIKDENNEGNPIEESPIKNRSSINPIKNRSSIKDNILTLTSKSKTIKKSYKRSYNRKSTTSKKIITSRNNTIRKIRTYYPLYIELLSDNQFKFIPYKFIDEENKLISNRFTYRNDRINTLIDNNDFNKRSIFNRIIILNDNIDNNNNNNGTGSSSSSNSSRLYFKSFVCYECSIKYLIINRKYIHRRVVLSNHINSNFETLNSFDCNKDNFNTDEYIPDKFILYSCKVKLTD